MARLRFVVPTLLGLLLFSGASFAGTVIYGLTNTPEIGTAICGTGCDELTSGTGSDVFSLVGPADIAKITFWTFEAEGSYQGGLLDWDIFTDVNNAPGALLASGQFSMLPRTFVQDVPFGTLTLEEFQNDISISSLVLTPSPAPESYFLQIRDSFGIFWASSATGEAFQLLGSGNQAAVPEPAGFCLALSALVTFAVWRRFARTSR
jgi:hypothetical protein